MNKTPNPDPSWLKSSPILSGLGQVPNCIALRKIDGYMPFVVHMAAFRDGEWTYGNGDYFLTLEEGLKRFGERA
jgi:hypothetical protein